LFYRAASWAAFPFLLLYVLWRIVRDRRYVRHLRERFGFWRLRERTAPGAVWLHAVSVGEALSAVETLRRMREEMPHTPLYVSCTTLAGREVAESKLSGIADGVFYAPIDMCFAVRRVLRLVRPSVLVVLETEIWPNLYRETRRAGASVVVVNGRISDKAAKKYKRFRWFFSAALEHVDDVLAQSIQDQQRFIDAGADSGRVRVAGNLKYDFQPDSGAAPDVVSQALRHPLWIAASTSAPMRDGDVDEDDVVIDAHRELLDRWPDLQLLIAPRKPERFDVVEEKLRSASLGYMRRSALRGGETPQVILLDSVGELSSLFAEADVVFMGGTLAERGGHNILEPALCSKPVVAGPHLENFAAIRDRFLASRGYVAIDGCGQLAGAIAALLSDPGARESLGARAKALAEAERGATARALRVIVEKRWGFVPRALPLRVTRPVLWVLSRIWIAGGYLKRRFATPRELSVPVISIGGIAIGGVGKTPMVRYLADTFRARGYKPAALTRGYKRRSRRPLVLARGSDEPVGVTGDEAQLLLRSCDVGIAADRWSVGREMEERFRPDVFLLDDGFQHAKLRRTVDIVMLDGIDPLAGDAVVPLGRLREPVKALRRADMIVIGRAGRRRFDGLLQRLPKNVPVFLSDVEIAAWHPESPGLDRVAAFCGLANPMTFFETLRHAGIRVLLTRTFPDHHRYTREELQSLAKLAQRAGARALVTTEKDSANLPEDADRMISPLKLHVVEVRLRLRNEAEFFAQLDALIGFSSHFNDGRASL
jgi:3-deoxy-D-manno-octulosonic-acid transferase